MFLAKHFLSQKNNSISQRWLLGVSALSKKIIILLVDFKPKSDSTQQSLRKAATSKLC